jgi:hypothetical protein
MARREIVENLCDMTHTNIIKPKRGNRPAETETVETMATHIGQRVMVNGEVYEIDLCDEHQKMVMDAFAKVVEHGREIKGAARVPAQKRGSGRRGAGKGRSNGTGETPTSDVRTWAQDNGFKVADRGRIPTEVIVAYQQAHGGAVSSNGSAPAASEPQESQQDEPQANAPDFSEANA